MEIKLSIVRQSQADRAAALQVLAERGRPTFEMPAAVEEPEFPTGILPGSAGAVRPQLAQINNRWQAADDAGYAQIFAGARADANTGVVVVMRTSPDRLETAVQVIDAPDGAGPLTIAAVESNGRLRLVDDGGSVFFFDPAAAAFVGIN